jgi:predicted PurR-regulated permease PerM
MNLGRHRRTRPPAGPSESFVGLDELQAAQLSSVFAPPRWLRDLGRASWLLVGVAALLAAVMWLLAQTSTIVQPVIAGLVVATVATPLVTFLQRHRWPRALGALAVLLGLLALAIVILLLVLGGITAQGDEIQQYASAAADKAEAWVEDAGVDSEGASSAKESVASAVPEILSGLVKGLAVGIESITSLAFAFSFSVFSVFFLLKDGPALRRWTETHLGVPLPAAQTITGDTISSVRRYFLGVTIVASFNAVVVGIGAVLLGVPLAGTIAVVTLVTAYIPFIGAVVSGAFAVILALGSEGTSTALIMLVIVLLANGMLQNVVQPIAFGATLDMNPLLVLVVTIAAGSLFGMVGLVLAAPLTSAAIHIARDLARARGAGAQSVEPEPSAEPETSAATGDAPPVPA